MQSNLLCHLYEIDNHSLKYVKRYQFGKYTIDITYDCTKILIKKDDKIIQAFKPRVEFGFNSQTIAFLYHDKIYVHSREYRIIFDTENDNVEIDYYLDHIRPLETYLEIGAWERFPHNPSPCIESSDYGKYTKPFEEITIELEK